MRTDRDIIARNALFYASKLWAKFLDLVRDAEWATFEMDMDPLVDEAIELGLFERVEYDPDKHGEIDDAEPGDIILHVTNLGVELEKVVRDSA
jgi:hypothetical protein